jgi:hypothetical protein
MLQFHLWSIPTGREKLIESDFVGGRDPRKGRRVDGDLLVFEISSMRSHLEASTGKPCGSDSDSKMRIGLASEIRLKPLHNLSGDWHWLERPSLYARQYDVALSHQSRFILLGDFKF